MRRSLPSLFLQAAAFVTMSVSVFPQDCKPPEIVFNKNADNIFSEEQENYLGEAIADQVQRTYRIIEDEEVNRTVRDIGRKIIRHLPPSNIDFQFFVIDLPTLNAFAAAGGRIYITRKLIAFVRSEDELAGVIAHELGHGIVRHGAIDFSYYFKKILKVDKVGDRKDVIEKYNQYLDKWRTKRVRTSRSHEDKQQVEADQIGIFAMAESGYDPEAFATVLERLTETRRGSGNWLSNVFGTKNRPAKKRIRKIVAAVKTIPAKCLDRKSNVSSGEFKEWQSYVISYSSYHGTENVRSVLNRKVLSPKLLSDTTHLEFSRNGEFIIAQDESGISVLRKRPLKILFRIEAPEAKTAHFTPESGSVVFNTTTKRVEKWSIAKKKPVLMREVFLRGDCWQTALSPDGRSFICYATNGDLKIVDVESNEMILRKKKFYILNYFEYFFFLFNLGNDGEIDAFQMQFSPSGRYFIAGRVSRIKGGSRFFFGYTQSKIFGFDFVERKEIDLNKDLKNIVSSPFAFYTDDKIIGQHGKDEKKSGIFQFPSGKRVEKFLLRGDSFTKPHKGNYLIVRPVSNAPVGIYDLAAKKFRLANKSSAIALFDQTFVTERRNGELGYYKLEKGELLDVIKLPESRFGRLRAVTVSSDLNWLAVSGKSRGGVWSLINGERYFYIRGFRGAFVDNDLKIYADFPALKKTKRQIGVIDLRKAETRPAYVLETLNTRQYGKFIVTLKSKKPPRRDKKKDDKNKDQPLVENPDDYRVRRNGTFQVRDVRTNSVLWSKAYRDELPRYGFSPATNSFTFSWRLNSKTAKSEIGRDGRLKRMRSTMRNKTGDYLVQVVNADTGKVTGQTLIETGEGSFRIRRTVTAGDWLAIIDSENRVMFYSLASGRLRQRFFGSKVAINPTNNIAAVENVLGRLSFYNLDSGEKVEEMTFKTPVAYIQFGKDGKKLFVLTSEQEVFLIDATKLDNSGAVAG